MASARDRRHANWFWLNKSLLDDYGQVLGVQGIAVYALLARCANEQGHAIPSLRYLAHTLGIGVNTVQRALDTLEREGFIARHRRRSEQGDFTSTEYILLTIEEKPARGVSTTDTRVSTTDTPPPTGDTGVSTGDTGVSTVGEQVYPPWGNGVSEVNNEQEVLNKNQMEQEPSPQTPLPAGEGLQDDALAVGEGSADAPCPTPDPPAPAPAKEAPWGKTMTPEAAACRLCDWRELVEVWQADGTPVLCRCPHDPVALEQRCQAHGYTREPPDRGPGQAPEPDARSP